jgi:hypothetical protein
MHAILFVGLITSQAPQTPPASQAPPALNAAADRTTLAIALERSQQLAERMLEVMPDNVRFSPRPRVQAILADVRRDKARLDREYRSPLFEAAVFVHYADVVQLAAERLGPDSLKFRAVRYIPADDIKMAISGTAGNTKTAKISFVDTLFTYNELQEMGKQAHALLDAMAVKDRLDPFMTAKWKKQVGVVNNELKAVEDELRMPAVLTKIMPEATLLGLYAKAISMSVNEGK